jgi:di/tricarboxylate transporter
MARNLVADAQLILLSQSPFPTMAKDKLVITMLLLLGIIVFAVTNILTPAISIPLAAMAALLLGRVKLSDTYKSVNWPAIATVGGMISLGLALEKTGAAEALATPSSPVFNGPVRFPFFVPCWRLRLH